jgi:hypothetical protein
LGAVFRIRRIITFAWMFLLGGVVLLGVLIIAIGLGRGRRFVGEREDSWGEGNGGEWVGI